MRTRARLTVAPPTSPTTSCTARRAGLSEKGYPEYLRDVKQLNTETMVWSRCRGEVAAWCSAVCACVPLLTEGLYWCATAHAAALPRTSHGRPPD